MSETPENEPITKRERSGTRMSLWVSLAVVAVVAIIAVFLVLNPVENDTAPAAAGQDGTESSTDPDRCDAPVGDTSAMPEMPEDLRWEAANGWTWPVSDTYGPTQEDNGYGVCFSRSPLGAALMGVSLIAEGNTGVQLEAVELYVMESPGKEVYRRTLTGAAPQEDPAVFSGFIVDSFSPDEAQITLVVSVPGSATGYAGIPETFRWVDGDWKLKVLDNGTIFQGQPTTPASGSFVSWGVPSAS